MEAGKESNYEENNRDCTVPDPDALACRLWRRQPDSGQCGRVCPGLRSDKGINNLNKGACRAWQAFFSAVLPGL